MNRRSILTAGAAALVAPAAVKAQQTPQERVTYHLEQAKLAMNEVNPGAWRVAQTEKADFALIVRDGDTKVVGRGVYTPFQYEATA